MITDKNRVFDGWLTLEGGVDAGRLPDTLDINQAQSARNMTFRGGSPRTRPGFRKLTEEFPVKAFLGPSDNIWKTKQTWCFNTSASYQHSLGTCVFTTGTSGDITPTVPASPHLIAGQKIAFTTTGTLPVSITPDSQYFVLDEGLTANKFRISATKDGTKIVFATAGTGVHTGTMFPVRDFISGEYKPDDVPLHATIQPPAPPPAPAPDLIIDPWFTDQNSEFIYKHGKLQSAIAYSPHNGEDCIMALIGGRLFKIVPDVTSAQVSEIVIRDEVRNLRNMQDNPIAYMVQADKWLIAQDGKSNAIIYDATRARRAKVSVDINNTEIPTGTIMAYGMGRICVIVNERDVAFGDLYGSHDFSDPGDSLILFTERNFLGEGFDAAIPFTQGVATGMIFFPQLDTSTGNGQLMVFAERGATSFFLSLERTQWKTSSFQILALLTTGLRGNRSISVVNEDLWFRSDDGVRSYRQARSEQTGWAHIPLSTNVKQYLETDSDWMLKYCSAIYFDNRILITTSPAWNNGRPIHWGMVVVDFDVLSSFGGSPGAPQINKPAWEGQWLSAQFLPIQMLTGNFNGVTRAFIFGMDSSGQNQLYELSRDDKDDFDGERINWELVTRSFDFNKLNPQASTVFTENELYDADLWLKDIVE